MEMLDVVLHPGAKTNSLPRVEWGEGNCQRKYKEGWQRNTCRDAQHHWSLGKWKLKPEGDINVYLLECLKLNRLAMHSVK